MNEAYSSAVLATLLLVLAAVALLVIVRIRRRESLQAQVLEKQIAERTADLLHLGEVGKKLTSTLNMEEAMDQVYRQISARIDTHVFAIGLCDEAKQCLREYYVREADVREVGVDYPYSERERPAVWCVTQRKEMVTATHVQLREYVQDLTPAQGEPMESVVYLPLILHDRVIGCLTVQSPKPYAYDAADLEFLRVLASYTAIAMANAIHYAQLDQRVAERTADVLKLGEIGKELTSTLDTEQAAERLYGHVSARLDAHVFAIMTHSGEEDQLAVDYAIEGGERLRGLSFLMSEHDRPAVWCVQHKQELIVDRHGDLLKVIGIDLPPKEGGEMESIVYMPLLIGERAIGCLTVQSPYEGAYTASQIEFLRALSSYTAIALENARSYARLDGTVAQLSTTLAELRNTQRSLVEREKMASLGSLVAGVAHEVNTPLGIALTSASHLDEVAGGMIDKVNQGKLAKAQFIEFQSTLSEGLRLIVGSLHRAHHLISSFKQVAVDQSSEQRRCFDLATALQEILDSLHSSYRKSGHQIDLHCPANIEMNTYPGALFQILTNFINNSLMHGFADGRSGRMSLEARVEDEQVELVYRDDGVGMSEAVAARAFEPFFTTRRNSGGSGLGLHLVYNLTTQMLGGTIALRSSEGQGVEFRLCLPRTAPHASVSSRTALTSPTV